MMENTYPIGVICMSSGIKINSSEIEKQMAQEYINGATIKSLLVKYGYKTKKSITDKVKKYFPNYNELVLEAKKNRKNYKINLSKINNNFVAYFYGLMASDGYVCENSNAFGIDMTDKDVIDFIGKITGKDVKEYCGRENEKKRYRIIFHDEIEKNNLISRGITPRKSHTIEKVLFEKDEEKYLPFFIRGVIDGDGSIGYTSYGQIYFSIFSASKKFIYWLKEVLENKLFMVDLNIYQSKDNVFELTTALKRNIEILKLLCYYEPFGMERKYNKLKDRLPETTMETSQVEDCIVQTQTEMA